MDERRNGFAEPLAAGLSGRIDRKVAAANPRKIVVLETGTAVRMPWLEKVSGVLEVWYGGSKGADAVANVLFGDVNPSAKLPMTFPRSEEDIPHPQVATTAGSDGSG